MKQQGNQSNFQDGSPPRKKPRKSMICGAFLHSLAEQAGFEPAVGLTPRTLSRRVT